MTQSERLAYNESLRRLVEDRAKESVLASVEEDEEVIFKEEPTAAR